MEFKQFYLGCLAQASYLIGSKGEAAIVDPRRDVDVYIEEASLRGLQIRYVIETHIHADFVSGHRELAARTGAEIVLAASADVTFPFRGVTDGEVLCIGDVQLKILETPGHTPESISVLVSEDSDPPTVVLTGDTLFIGDVGRPDLVGSKGLTAATMAGHLYDSLHQKLLTLDDAVAVYPAHGAGSLCGRNLSSETSSTIGQQRRFNYALRPMPREEFVELMTTALPESPSFFARDAEMNRAGAVPLSTILAPAPLSGIEVQTLQKAGHVVLDVRTPAEFGSGHLPGALNVGLGGQFATWCGILTRPQTAIILCARNEEQVSEAVIRLARVGIENVDGYLSGGVESWHGAGLEVATIPQISVEDLKRQIDAAEALQVIDVRRPAEYESGHVPGAAAAQLSSLRETAACFDRSKPTAVICAGGYRSSAGTSVLESLGFRNLLNVNGGTAAWVKAGYPMEESAAATAG